MAYATVEDVRARSDKPLTAEQEALAATRLGDAELRIRRRVRDLDARVADAEYRKVVVMVEAEAVLRVLRNPEGFNSETDGDYSYSRSPLVASGRIGILEEEWEMLGVGSRRAGTVAPTIGTPRRGPVHRRGRPYDAGPRGPW
ncbi:Phage protein Gp19/Gp15/Gp42 [Sinosporangium album]|uniref:Phage protein Gp19/Gp15/Gp42 n=1 Tax=Sinosporangium album TaxID=504805 RepID=A0A1G8KCD9_9ACTN|nr:Gp19/Gp15/Gp42 family protein [Sinosporangium album]SDI41019.1 Phage protein Gp19/Gp15/Gp42 [Sinosporangium album]